MVMIAQSIAQGGGGGGSPPSFVIAVGVTAVSVSVGTATTPNIQPTGSNRLLVVTIGEYGQGANASSVVFNGSENLTLLSGSDGNFYDSGGRSQTWYLINPSNVSATVVVTFPGNVVQYAVTACAFSGVNQSTPFGTVATDYNNTNRTTTSTSPGTATSDLGYFAGIYVVSGTFSADSPSTQRQKSETVSGVGVLAATSIAGSPTTTGAFTITSGTHIYSMGVAIKS